ncbi:MAG: non-heme iron oxygenase ferredoxin subunit [Actinobacteria bacterium ATB1]|nr:non-heme iron oxygenase ferredoxin subunit [Actinobacteria bacterium ATB1]
MTDVRVARLDELAEGTPRKVEVDGFPVVIVRIGDSVYALGDTCSHAEASLSEGEVYVEEKEIECPLHGSTFVLESGEPTCLPATEPVPTFEVVLTDGDVWVASR